MKLVYLTQITQKEWKVFYKQDSVDYVEVLDSKQQQHSYYVFNVLLLTVWKKRGAIYEQNSLHRGA